MAYNKKNWQDNVSDITAAELNRMEQGIYDNSLVVDAVTNTLNPTDTETYKTAELTEGQINDVIGVNDIIIKGQTSQDGEPTPSSPVDVNVVSGSNVINTSNKNLFNYANDFLSGTSNGITITRRQNGTYSYVGTATSATVNVWLNGTHNNWNNQLIENALFKIPSGKTITAKDVRVFILYEDLTKIQLYEGTSLTLAQNAYIMTFRAIQAVSGTTYNKVCYPQLEISSTATPYEPHQGKELPLDLPVENLLNANFVQGSYNSDAALDRISCRNVQLKANTTYSLSTDLNYNNFNIALGTSTELFPHSSAFIYDSGWKNSNFSFTTGNVDVYCNISIKKTNNSNITPNDVSEVQFQLEQGSKVNAYTPFGTEPIELCKIGNYQDYFYKSGSKWYLHKEIVKKVIDGNESWNYYSTGRYFYNLTILNDLPRSASVKIAIPFVSNKFLYTGAVGSPSDNQMILVQQPDRNNEVDIRYDSIGDVVADFKNWLSTNNISVYHSLVTPTDTEITDTTLISQLEAIYNAPLYEETNITQTNNDLPMVLDITACKDNINGIKAFIRK